MSEHTPTPWAVDPDHRPGMGWNAHVVEAADPNNRVCFMTSGPEGKVNAAFIVKAANNHDALVKALTAAVRIVADRAAGGRMLTNKEDANAVRVLCNEAISAANATASHREDGSSAQTVVSSNPFRSDLVKRLRLLKVPKSPEEEKIFAFTMDEAADEIERLQGQLVKGKQWQWNGQSLKEDDPDWVASCTEPTWSQLSVTGFTGGMTVHATRGDQRIKSGDWIVCDENGQIYIRPAFTDDLRDPDA